ncbi:MAG TPA: hypothetical protein VMJ30_05945 [Gemmatimonadales bacterium]|nr:hypothetical protein [Gemmatimonadales bacterium]
MPSSKRARILAAAAVSAFVVGAACGGGDNNGPNCGSGSPPDLSGGYNLLSYKVGTTNVPDASGTLILYPATGGAGPYAADLNLLANEVIDSGTYTLTGSACIKQESVSGNGTTNGTYTIDGDTVSVTGTSTQAGGTIVARWLRAPT